MASKSKREYQTVTPFGSIKRRRNTDSVSPTREKGEWGTDRNHLLAFENAIADSPTRRNRRAKKRAIGSGLQRTGSGEGNWVFAKSIRKKEGEA